MRDSRFQNRVAESVFTFPSCVMLAALLWWRPLAGSLSDNIIGIALCALTAFSLIATDFYCRLIRKHSQLSACYWLLCVATMGFFRQGIREALAVTAFTASFHLLFQTCQRREPMGMVFNSFFLLSLGGMACPGLLYLAVCYWWYMYAFMRCLTVRTFGAGLIGLIVPFWFLAVWCMWTGDTDPLLHIVRGLLSLQRPCWEWYVSLPVGQVMAWSAALLLSLVGGIHYLANCYDDSISVRMCLYVCVCQTVVSSVALLFHPFSHALLLPMTVVSSAPLVSHYFSLANSRASSIFFILALMFFAAMAALRLWMPSYFS